MIHISFLSKRESKRDREKKLNKMASRISQKNRGRGKVMLEFKPLKTLGKTRSSSCMFNVVNFHMSSRRSQSPAAPGPLTSSA